MREARCNTCGARIVWALTEKGKRMPVDAEPAPDGGLMLRTDGPEVTVTAWTGAAGSRPRYRSHFSTCPQADQHRRTS